MQARCELRIQLQGRMHCFHLSSAWNLVLINIADVVVGVTVQRLFETVLVDIVTNEANGTTKHEQTVKNTHIKVLRDLILRESTAIAHKIDEHASDGTINVENQCALLLGGYTLHSTSEVQNRSMLEVGSSKLLQLSNTSIRILEALDLVANTRDKDLLGMHLLNKVLRVHLAADSGREQASSIIESTTEAGANSQETRAERGHEILAGTGCDNGVMRTRHSGTVISGQHQRQLNETREMIRQALAEPQEAEDAADTHILADDSGDGNASILELFTALIGDGGDECSALTDQTELASPGVVDRDGGRGTCKTRHELSALNKGGVEGVDGTGQLIEGLGHMGACKGQCTVLGNCGFGITVSAGTGVAELDIMREDGCDGTNAPCDDRFGELAFLHELADTEFFSTTDFTEENNHFGITVVFVAKQVIDEGSTRETVTTDSDTLIDTVSSRG